MSTPVPQPSTPTNAAGSSAASPSLTEPAGGAARGSVRRPAAQGRLWVVLISSLVIVGGLAGIVRLFGKVTGREFAPSHFETRTFSFIEIPLVQLQITPIKRSSQYSRLAAYLSTSGTIPRPQGPPAVWHLVELSRPATSAEPADAKLLVDLMEHHHKNAAATSALYWHQWSIDHPELATILWPEVQKLASRELYVLIPDLFQIADAASSPESLSADMHAYLKSSYARLIRDAEAADQTALAQSLRQEAMSDYPDDPQWQQP